MWAKMKGGKIKMMFNLNFSFLLIPSCQLSVGLWGHESAANPHISEHRKYLQLQTNIILQIFWLKILCPYQIFPLSTNNKSNCGVVDINFNIWEALHIPCGKEGLLFRCIFTNGPILWRGETDQNTQSTIQRKTIFNKYFSLNAKGPSCPGKDLNFCFQNISEHQTEKALPGFMSFGWSILLLFEVRDVLTKKKKLLFFWILSK